MDRSEWEAAGYADWPHFVRVDCDYCADGLWTEGGSAFSLEHFPISDDLKERLTRWQVRFDAAARWQDDCVPDDTHVREGHAIAIEVKRQLRSCLVVAIDRRVRRDLTLGERVPFPGEWTISSIANGGEPYRRWREAMLAGVHEP